MTGRNDKFPGKSTLLLYLLAGFIFTACAPQENIKKDETQLKPENQDIVIKEEYGIDERFSDKFTEAVDLLKAQDYKGAIILLEEVVAHTEKHSAPFVDLGIAYLAEGDIEKSEQYLQKALQINPEHPVAANEMAMLYRRSGRFKEAKELYERILQKYPLFLPARKNLGILCDLFMKDLECARQHYQAYMDIETEDEKVKLWLTDVNNRLGVKK